jgi:hypothetical protein
MLPETCVQSKNNLKNDKDNNHELIFELQESRKSILLIINQIKYKRMMDIVSMKSDTNDKILLIQGDQQLNEIFNIQTYLTSIDWEDSPKQICTNLENIMKLIQRRWFTK